MKRFAMILLAAVTLVIGSGVASAQSHGGGGWHGGGGGGWHGGSSWHGGSGWHGGAWGGGWHGSAWHGGNWGGWHGGWGGSRVVIGVGPWWGWGWGAGWGWGWWPWAPAWGWGWGAPAASWGWGAGGPDSSFPTVDSSTATFVQRDPSAVTEGQFSQGQQYFYYCPDAGYYPQVPTCARGWLRVLPSGTPGPAAPVQSY